MLLRELKDMGATVAWSPFSGGASAASASTASILATGTKEGAGGGFDDYGGKLEVCGGGRRPFRAGCCMF